MSNEWPIVALGDIFAIARGGSPRPIQEFITDDPDGVNWITISDATESSKHISTTRRRITKAGASRSRMVHPGDFLLTNSMSFGRPYIMNTSGCIHDGWLVLDNREQRVDSDYFFHLLGSATVYSEFERLAAGVTVKNLNIDLVKKVCVPLPPLAEQQRIAKVLDAADALRAKRRTTLLQLDKAIQSIFIDLFEDPTGDQEVWPLVALEEIADLITGYPFRSEEYVTEGETVRLCRGANVFPGRIDWSDLARWPTSKAGSLQDFSLNTGDIIIAMDRPWISQGFKIARLLPEDCPSLLVQRVARLRGRADISNEYLFHLLSQPTFARHCRPTETTIPHISPKEIRSFTVPVPPIALQQEFAHRVAAVERLKSAHRAHLAELDALFASLQHRAFRGEL